MKIIISQGRVIDPGKQFDQVTDIAIESGRIVEMGELSTNDADKVIDATDHLVIPSLVDLCNRPHLKHPQGAMWQHEAGVALKRGIGAICIPPDSTPEADYATVKMIQSFDQDQMMPTLYSIGFLSRAGKGQSMTDYELLKDSGCIALSQAQMPISDKTFLRSCYEYAQSVDLPIIIQPREYDIAPNGCVHDGVVATRLGLPAIPYTAETIALQTHLAFIEELGVKAHFTALSCQQSVDLIAQAKQKGLPVTADVAMHSLLLSEIDLIEFDGNCHLYPPLRSQTDQLGLIQGVANNVIDAICSDHRPLDSMAKLAPFPETVPGLSAIDCFLSLGLYLVAQGKLDLLRLVDAISTRPAGIFQLSEGALRPGQPAHLNIVDPKAYWQVIPESMKSKGKNSPFIGWELPGIIKHVFFQGSEVKE